MERAISVPRRIAARNPGDAVIFNIKIYHAAFGEGIQRRAIYVHFVQEPRTAEEEAYIVGIYRGDASHGWTYYTPELFEDAPPKRTRLLTFLKERCYEPISI